MRRLLPALLLSSVLFPIACMKAPDPDLGIPQNAPTAAPTTPDVHFDGLEGWTSTPPTQSFYLQAWSLPEGGIANISWFGASTAQVGANINRWLNQFQVEGGSAAEAAEISEQSSGHYPYTLIVLEGTMTAVGQVGGGEPREDWMLLGAVVHSPSGPLYVKALGPISVLRYQREAFVAALDALDLH